MSACLDPGKRVLWNQIGADGAALTGRRSEACRAGGALRASRRAPKSGGHSGGAIRLFRGARRCGLWGARSLLPGVLERLRLGLTSPSTQPLLPGRVGAPCADVADDCRRNPPPRACWSAADEFEPSSKREPPSGAAGACAARVECMRGLAECGGVRKARTMVADSRGYVPCFHSP